MVMQLHRAAGFSEIVTQPGGLRPGRVAIASGNGSCLNQSSSPLST